MRIISVNGAVKESFILSIRSEFISGFELDFSKYPNKEQQYEFFKAYLKTLKSKQTPTESDLHNLYVEVNKFSLVSVPSLLHSSCHKLKQSLGIKFLLGKLGTSAGQHF